MVMKKKLFLIAAFVLLVAAMLSSCGAETKIEKAVKCPLKVV